MFSIRAQVNASPLYPNRMELIIDEQCMIARQKVFGTKLRRRELML